MWFQSALSILLVGFWSVGTPANAAKLVYYGWGLPSASYVASHLTEMEGQPFDGTAIAIPIDRTAWSAGKRDPDNQLGWAVFGSRRFGISAFADTIAELGSIKWRRFTENFLPVVINTSKQTQDLSWFDDAHWETITQNWSILLKIARRAHCRGVILDPEDYGGHLFDYDFMVTRHPGSFEQYQAIARRRGRDLMRHGRQIFPSLVVLGLFGPSLPLDIDSEADLTRNRYALFAAFVDGLVDGADSDFRFVDGGEFSYTLRDPEQFRSLRATMRQHVAARSTLPDSARHRIQVGFGLWIDNGGKRHWFAEQPWRNYFTPSGFEDALTAALRESDEYVWIYSQEVGFFPPVALPREYLDAMQRALKAASLAPKDF
jgi:hypothetical protein